MRILSGYDLYKGKRFKNSELAYGNSNFWQPLQMLPEKEKDENWVEQMMNWAEWEGLQQIRLRANWMMKNYKLSIGEIEKADYLRESSEYADTIDALEKQAGRPLEAMELKNFPLANTCINVVVDEFSKRVSHMSFDDKSPTAANEMLEEKKAEIEQYLLSQLAIKQQQKMQAMGLSEDSEEGQKMMDPATLKSLPEIQAFYSKSYRNIYQEWAQHQMNVDSDRFAMPELERTQFRNMLITDREFWHFRMMESDYDIEAWNPPQVFYRKSPSSKYMSDASRIGYVEYLTVPDVIDRDGYKMTEDQLLALNTIQGTRSSAYAIDGTMSDNYWDKSRSYDWNRTGPGLGMRQAMSVLDGIGAATGYSGDIIKQIQNEGEEVFNENGEYLIRRTTLYWKTQRKYFQLSKIDEVGNFITEIVGEDYKITTKPMYNTVLYKEKTKENLVYGEHLDPLWANEAWGGVRIGTNIPSIGWQATSTNNFAPIYLGVNGGKPGRLPFQFKGDKNVYGCKLPVEGAVFNDLNTKSRAFIDNIKPYQIPYNITNNLIQDTMINDWGVVVQIDPNAINKHSLGEDYGTDPLQSTITIAKDLSVIPAFSAGKNADGEHIGAHPIQRLDLSQTERLLGLVKLAEYFKTAGLDSVGLNPQRLGSPIDKEDTATGVQQQVAASYSHTEYLFTQHSDDLMPRVHQMRTDLAQYYHSTNPSVRLQYLTDSAEKAFFEIDGTKLLGREFNVRCTTRVNARSMLLQIKQLLLTNNTSGANLFDLVRGMQIPTVTEMNTFMKELEQRQTQENQAKMQQEQQMHDSEIQQQIQLQQERQQFEAEQNDEDRKKDIYVAEIQAESKSVQTSSPDTSEAAYEKGLDRVEAQNNFRETMNLDREKHLTDTRMKMKDQQIAQQKIQAENQRTKQEAQATKLQQRVKEKNDKNKSKK